MQAFSTSLFATCLLTSHGLAQSPEMGQNTLHIMREEMRSIDAINLSQVNFRSAG